MQELLLIQGLHVNFSSNKAVGTSPETLILYITLQPKMPIDTTTLTTVTEDLEYIQPHTFQVWNYDMIGFYPNVSWIKLVSTYKLFTGDRMWRTHTTDREPYWCTALIFARAYGQCFMSPVIVHQAENCIQDLH